MKREHATGVFIRLSYPVSAQPILTESVIPVTRTVFESFTQIDPPLNQCIAGPHQVWDFSSMETSQSGQVLEYLDPNKTPYATQSSIGISEIENNIQVHIYPNPVSDFLIIDEFGIAKNFIITNAIGKKFNIVPAVERKHLNLDVTLLPPGLYTINVSRQAQILTYKFLVNR